MTFTSAYRGRPGSFSSAHQVRRPGAVDDAHARQQQSSTYPPATTTEFFDWVLSKLPKSEESHDGRVLLDDGHGDDLLLAAGSRERLDDEVGDDVEDVNEADSWMARARNITDSFDALYPVSTTVSENESISFLSDSLVEGSSRIMKKKDPRGSLFRYHR